MNQITTNKTSLTIKRVYKATPERLFKALTDPKELARWYAPDPMTPVVHRFEAKKGGSYEVEMTSPEGNHTCYGKILEVVPNQRLVQSFQWKGDEWDEPTLLSIELRPVAGGTELTLKHEKFDEPKQAEMHAEGWASCADRLAKVVA